VRFIPGDAEIPGLANLSVLQKKKLLTSLKTIPCDFLILDLGAGSSFNVIDFFLSATRGLVITMPTLTSTLNAYLFLKNTLFRILSQFIKQGSATFNLMKKLEKDGREQQKLPFLELLKVIQGIEPKVYDGFREKTGRFLPRLILNLLEDEKDTRFADRIRRSLHDNLGIEIEHLGIIYRDVVQDIALNSRMPVIIYKPGSLLAQAIYRIADKIMQFPDEDAGLFEIDTDETFQTAEIEARIDFSEKMHSIEELMYSGELSEGDLFDIIKQQHIEISNLKKENQLLKTKLSRAVKEGFKL
jgi:flagellar biosynthesis protein FlhG